MEGSASAAGEFDPPTTPPASAERPTPLPIVPSSAARVPLPNAYELYQGLRDQKTVARLLMSEVTPLGSTRPIPVDVRKTARFISAPELSHLEMADRLTGEELACPAKRTDVPYQSGNRTGMVKIKKLRTADCVVGGFRYATKKREVGSLLLGLYDNAGLLHHVGFTSAIPAADRPALTAQLEALVEAPGFTGDAPGGPSRWSTERSAEWQPLRPELIAEVRYDHVTGRRFRHGTGFLRWRPDKAPRQCTMEQLGEEARPAIVEAALKEVKA